VKYRYLGGTGLEVSTYCLGTMMFGFIGNADHDDCVRIVHAALDRGINFVDSADMYSDGESEIIVGKALRERRDEVILATKGHFQMGDGRNRSGNSRRWLTQAVEASLKRLETDWIDLYQVHRPDPATDIEETLSTLTDLVYQGKIRAFGCSTFPAEQIVDAHHVAQRRGLLRFRTEQPQYSLLVREIENSVLPVCQRLGMGVLTWSPLAAGFLSGKVRREGGVAGDLSRPNVQPALYDLSDPANQRKLDASEQFALLAAEIGCTLPELAIAFTISHPGVTSAIIGPRTMEQLDALLNGASLELDDTTLNKIDEIVPPGTDLATNGKWRSPAIDDAVLRRRRPPERAAA
jgi:aryl-alcohol dehydrogenase-like predicted oxidoreductase